jgi:hypothetical protein
MATIFRLLEAAGFDLKIVAHGFEPHARRHSRRAALTHGVEPMRLDVHVMGRKVASLFRERDEYVLQYSSSASPGDFVSLTMPVREAPWRWPSATR